MPGGRWCLWCGGGERVGDGVGDGDGAGDGVGDGVGDAVGAGEGDAAGVAFFAGMVVATGWMGVGCATDDGTAADGLGGAIAAGRWVMGSGVELAASVSVSPVTPTTASSAIPPASACCCRGARRIHRGACPICLGARRSQRNPASTEPGGADGGLTAARYAPAAGPRKIGATVCRSDRPHAPSSMATARHSRQPRR